MVCEEKEAKRKKKGDWTVVASRRKSAPRTKGHRKKKEKCVDKKKNKDRCCNPLFSCLFSFYMRNCKERERGAVRLWRRAGACQRGMGRTGSTALGGG